MISGSGSRRLTRHRTIHGHFMSSCIFCKIVDGGEPASFIHRGELCSAFLDIRPVTPGHVLIVPNAHAGSIRDMDDDTLQAMMRTARAVDHALRASSVACEGVMLFMADGAAADQKVAHAHLHVFPRFVGDGFGFVYPEGFTRGSPREDLDTLAAELRGEMGS